MEERAKNDELSPRDILLAILVNLKRQCEKRQLFMRAGYNKFQDIFRELLQDPEFQYLQNYFVFSEPDPVPFSSMLQKAIEKLQFSGLICWPTFHEPDVMRLNPSAEDWYDKVLMVDTERRLPLQDIIQKIARIAAMWSALIVDRPHLTNC
jgi:hypothetical protein